MLAYTAANNNTLFHKKNLDILLFKITTTDVNRDAALRTTKFYVFPINYDALRRLENARYTPDTPNSKQLTGSGTGTMTPSTSTNLSEPLTVAEPVIGPLALLNQRTDELSSAPIAFK
jgi:hypothetical protein